MKKIFIALLLMFVPLTVNATETAEKLYINAHLLENGDMTIKMFLVVKGPLNGYEIDLLYKKSPANWDGVYIDFSDSPLYNATGISDLAISAIPYKKELLQFDNIKLNMFDEVKSASTGTSGVYVVNKSNLSHNVRIYYPTSNNSITFYASYTLKDVAVIHNDIAEIYWNFIGSSFRENIKEVEIKLYLPNSDNSDNFRVYAHSSLVGEIQKIETNGAIITMTNYQAGNDVDMRIIFDKNVLNETIVLKKTNQNALDKILEIEEKRAEERNVAIKKAQTTNNIMTILSGLYIAGAIALAIYIYLKYDKEHKSDFKSQYYREFIEDYDVEVIDYLMQKNITSNAMSASIMNLIYKKKIKAEVIEGKKKDYVFELLNTEDISVNEKYLIEFLFNRVGSGSLFTTIELKKYASSTKTYDKFTSSYENWKNKIITEGKKQEFYESNGGIKAIAIIYALFGLLLFIFNISANIENGLPIFALIVGIVLFFYAILFSKRTEKGNEHYSKWNAFKNFLNDFGTFDQKELPEIILWERYLVYAVIFGLAKKVQKGMNVKIKEISASDGISPSYMDLYLYHHLSMNISNSVSTAVRGAQSAAVQAASSYASGSGSGGGFSSGGGGGGGGLGGGRF